MSKARAIAERDGAGLDGDVPNREDMARVETMARARDRAQASGDSYFFCRAIEAAPVGGVPAQLATMGVTLDMLAELAEMEAAERGSRAPDAVQRAEHFRREAEKLDAEARRFEEIVARAEADHRAAIDLRLKLLDRAQNLVRKKAKLSRLRAYHARFLRLGLLKGKHYFDALERAREIGAIDVVAGEIAPLEAEVGRLLQDAETRIAAIEAGRAAPRKARV